MTFLLVAIGFILALGFGFIAHGFIMNGREAELIQRGFAIYCPDDGAFAFKGECND